LKQEDLKLDPNKKRKKNPPGTAVSTPATNQGTPAPVPSPQQTKTRKLEPNSFKCTVTGCEHQTGGFQTKDDLDAHTKTAHKPPEEHIADPRAFFIEHARRGLGLDESGQPPKKVDTQPTQEGLKAADMQKSFSRTSAANIKTESKPSTPAAMARGPSQNGMKPGSPASNLPRTPQLGGENALGDKSAGAATTIGKTTKAEHPGASLWESSPIPLASLQETFNDINMDSVMALDPGMDIDNLMGLYLQSNIWTKPQPDVNGIPPDDSSNESPAQNSDDGRARQPSLDSDASKSGDETFVKIDDIDMKMVDVDDSWSLPELVGHDNVFLEDDEWGNITFDELNMSEDEGEAWKDVDWDKLLQAEDADSNEKADVARVKA
jgi:hypothetical protein